MPSTPYDAKGLLKSAIRDDNPVIYFMEFKVFMNREEVPDEDYTVPIGKERRYHCWCWLRKLPSHAGS